MPTLSLKPLPGYKPYPGPLVTIIMDGVGLGKRDESDGVFLAYKPVLDALFKEKLFTKLKAHGKAVGLPSDDDMGNSEVGHNALGAGRVFAQGAKLVNEAIASGKIFEGKAWKSVMERAQSGKAVHFIGLLSDGNVHSHVEQLYALLERCAKEGVRKVRVHPLLDGRDVGEKSALDYVVPLEDRLAAYTQDGRDYRVASGGGRMVTTMDRYGANWGVVEKGWRAHVLGMARQFKSASEAVRAYYAEDPKVTDQYMDSFVVAENGEPVGPIEDGDAVVFFNFRGDRAIEISRAFEEPDFKEFDRERLPDVFFAGMMEYDGDAKIPKYYLVEPPAIDRTLGQYLCAAGVSSFACAETQKFGHVTYFWNGNNSGYLDAKLEKYVEVPSDRVPFDQRPWMKAGEVTDELLSAIASGERKFIRANFANGDMVGHTGNLPAVRIAVESVDLALSRLVPAIEKAKGVLMVTADHGNADKMFEEKNGKRTPFVAHTLNPVPFIVKDFSGANRWELSGVQGPGLSHVAATLCALLGFAAPEGYDPAILRLV
ncbi:MAG TPA: 2,3-bisphosphoglycerate-independent phosphoglycerate mutase [Elusimicrobia bacterium]|nr:2,3-bisphosphoglycerate-independent phosphoglycerate mutase [Elusimicrobiota bacterium]